MKIKNEKFPPKAPACRTGRDRPQAEKIKKIGLLLISLIFLLTACSGKEEKALEAVKVERGDIKSEISSTGTVMPRNRVEIKPPIAGRIDSVLVEEGQKVEKGEILAWMSSTERAALLDAARSQGEEEIQHWNDVYKPAPIVAPLNGFIIRRNVEPGQTVTSGDAVLVMADFLIVKAQVDETDLASIRLKQDVELTLDAYPEKKISGRVEHIAYESTLVSNVNIYEINIMPAATPKFFRAGMSATANFISQEKKGVLLLPMKAVKKSSKRSYIFAKRSGDKDPKAYQIETGLENTSNLEILSGVNEGESVYIPTPKMVESIQQSGRRRGPTNPFVKKSK